MSGIKNILLVVMLVMHGCKRTESQSVAQNTVSKDSVNAYIDNSDIKELTFGELMKKDSLEKMKLYSSLLDSLPDIRRTKDVDATTYIEEDLIPSLPADEVIYLHYRQKVRGYKVMVEYVPWPYDDIAGGKAILHFSKAGHSFDVYCDEFIDEQFIPDNTPYVKSKKTINLSNVKPGAKVHLNYALPKSDEYLSDQSPFYFKDMDFDGEEELVVNNLRMGTRNYNTYDVYKVLHVSKPVKLKGLPFSDKEYKITNYNVEYVPQNKSVLDNRHDGFDAYGYYRYKSIPTSETKGLKRLFILEEAMDIEHYHLKDHQASDSINLIEPYKKYKRIKGKMVLTERGVYESGNYGWNREVIVLEKNNQFD